MSILCTSRTLAALAVFFWVAGCPVPVCAQESAGDYFVYVGSYTNPTPTTISTAKGIYRFRFDSKSGALESIGLVAEAVNPAHLWASESGQYLYSVNWRTGDKSAGDTVSAYSVDHKTGSLTFLNKVSAHGDWANQVVLDPRGEVAVTVTYQSGTVSALPVERDGRLGEPFYTDQHVGTSVDHNPPGPHAHGVVFSHDGRVVYVTDLGLDRIYSYHLDASKRLMRPSNPAYIDVKKGSGPRRLQLHPSGRYLYVNLETTSAVSTFEVSGSNLVEIQTLSTLPAGYVGNNVTAEIEIDHTGRFLYVSNRGHNSIACYQVDPLKGTLVMTGNVPSQGSTPRNLRVDPTNRYLLVANQLGENVVVFRMDPETGHLTPIGANVPTPQPGSMVFVKAGD